MRAEHVNAFLVPSVQVLRKMAGLEVQVGPVDRFRERPMEDHLSIIVGLQGRLVGSVVLTAEKAVALSVAQRVAGDGLAEGDVGEVRAILAELANTIVGNAVGHLYDLGFREGITPPTVIEGGQLVFGFLTGLETVVIPLETEAGELSMIVSLSSEAP